MSDDLAPVPDAALSQWDRYLRDPSVDVAKLQALFELWERAQKRTAEMAYNTAFADMQGELPTIDEGGVIRIPGQPDRRYAEKADIVEAIKPILQRHGFALSFRHEYPNGKVKTIGILLHRAGHSERDEFEALPDKSGNKNDIQASASTRTYGERYATISLLNIVSRDPKDKDRDGYRNGTVAAEPPAKPKGFDDWLTAFERECEGGWDQLQLAWKMARPEYRQALSQPQREALKQRAREADAKRQAATP